MKHKKRIKTALLVLFLILNIGIVSWIAVDAFKQDSTTTFRTMVRLWASHWPYLIALLVLPLIAIFAEGLKYLVMIFSTTRKIRFGLAMKTAAIGKYYDNITPLGTGGQPFQVYYLYKNKVPSDAAGVLPIVAVTVMQLALVILSVLVFVFYGDVIQNNGLKIAAYFGTAFSMLFPLAVIAFSFLPTFSFKIASWGLRLLHTLHLVKRFEEKMKKTEEYLVKFKRSMQYIAKSVLIILPLFILSVIYHMALFSIPYVAIKAAGMDVSYIQVTAMCVYVYAAIAFIPTPGNSGGAEVSFTMIFTMLSGGVLFWTMLLWRFAGYFFVIIIGLLIVLYDFGLKRVSQKPFEESI